MPLPTSKVGEAAFPLLYPDFQLPLDVVRRLPLQLSIAHSSLVLRSSLLNYYYYDEFFREWKRFDVAVPENVTLVTPAQDIVVDVLEHLKEHDPYYVHHKMMQPFAKEKLPRKTLDQLNRDGRLLQMDKTDIGITENMQRQALESQELERWSKARSTGWFADCCNIL